MRNCRKRWSLLILLCMLLFVVTLTACNKEDIREVADGFTEKAEQAIDEAASKYKGESQEEKDAAQEAAEEEARKKAEEEAAKKAYQLSITKTSGDRYAYGTLDAESQQVYDEVYYAINHYEDTVEVSTKSTSVLDNAFNAVYADYGEIFWVNGYSYHTYYMNNDPGNITKIEFSPTYTMTEGERDSYQELVESKAEGYLSEACMYATDYEKVLYLFERLITDVDYVKDSPENQNILSVFLYGETVCSGYANAMQYLCNQLGITCAVVKGTAQGESHAWNLVKMDGDFYYVDVTWGNAAYSLGDEAAGQYYYINYGYFGLTTEEITKTHSDSGEIKLPACTATADNYFVKRGLFFEAYDAATVGNIIKNAYDNGASQISIKFGSVDAMNAAMDDLITQGNVVNYCIGLTQLRYLTNMELCVLDLDF